MLHMLKRLLAGILWTHIGLALWSLMTWVVYFGISSYTSNGVPSWLIPIVDWYTVVVVEIGGAMIVVAVMVILSMRGRLPWTR